MSRDGMPRAYLRISPDIDMHPDALAMVRAMCAAARQPTRGRFRDPKVLERVVGRRQYREMVHRGDVVPANPGPGIYLDGWDEWQEGDFTVTERMRRMRAKRKAKGVTHVTPPPSPRRNGVTTDAVELGEIEPSSTGGDVPPNPPPSGGHGLRANGTSPRQVAKVAADAEKAERERRKRAVQDLNLRYYRGEMSEADHAHALAELGQ